MNYNFVSHFVAEGVLAHPNLFSHNCILWRDLGQGISIEIDTSYKKCQFIPRTVIQDTIRVRSDLLMETQTM